MELRLVFVFACILISVYGENVTTSDETDNDDEKYYYPNMPAPEPCYNAKDDRIIEGKVAPTGAFPYQASLRAPNNHHYCGGSIISERWILTAAHCLHGLDVTNVVVGTNYLNHGGDRYYVQRRIVHQRYNPTSIVNDIGLVLLRSSIRFSNVVQPIKLPKRDIDYDNYPAIASGWGKYQLNGPTSNKLQYLQTCLMDKSACAAAAPTASVSQKICTFTFPGQGVCQGDSGGPLIADGVLIGITSYVVTNCAQGYPDYFTRVAYFLSWIKDNTRYYI